MTILGVTYPTISRGEAVRALETGEMVIAVDYLRNGPNDIRRTALFHYDDENMAEEFADLFDSEMYDWATGERW